MATYKDRIGEIPNDWEAVNGYNYLLLESGMRPAEHVTDNSNDIPSLGGENITSDGFLTFKNVRYISREYFARMPKGKLIDGDILINKDGANTGKLAFAKTNPFPETSVNEHVFLIRNKGDFEQDFLFYFLLSALGQNQIQPKVVGSAQPGINNSFTKGLYIPKPPKPEQRTIASILSKVDEAIAATKNSIAKAERLKKSLMQNLLTGKLKPDGTWRKEDEFYMDEKYGNVPKGWVYEKLGKLILKITDGEHLSPDMQDKGEYIVSAEDVFDDGVHFEKAKYVSTKDCIKFRKRCDPEFGDVLIVSRGASVGRTCKVQTTKLFCMMGSVILIKPQQEVLTNEFISLYLKTYEAWKELRRISGSSAQQAIYLAHLKKMRIMYPINVTEQSNITKSFEGVYKTILQKEEKLKKLERLKKALMQNLLTGKVRVKIKETLNG